MRFQVRVSSFRTLAVLHPVFALTGVLHTVGGALLPSLAARFHLSDADSGLLFFLYFAGTSLGALLCRRSYARTMAVGLVGVSACSIGIAAAGRPILPLLFLLLGVSVGTPMSAVSLYVGRAFPERCAPILTSLNFSWSAGALAAPLIAARVLRNHTYQSAYLLFSVTSLLAAVACYSFLVEPAELARPQSQSGALLSLRLVISFAFVAFLEVGIENTVAAWLPTYALRLGKSGIVIAAVSSSLFWAGFLSSRGISSLLLMRVEPTRLFRNAVVVGLFAAIALVLAPSPSSRNAAMLLMGAALAPIFPLVIAGSLARFSRTSDSRWVLATAGFGGSVLPWLAGWISAHAGSIRMGMLIIPSSLAAMLFMLPAFRSTHPVIPEQQETEAG